MRTMLLTFCLLWAGSVWAEDDCRWSVDNLQTYPKIILEPGQACANCVCTGLVTCKSTGKSENAYCYSVSNKGCPTAEICLKKGFTVANGVVTLNELPADTQPEAPYPPRKKP